MFWSSAKKQSMNKLLVLLVLAFGCASPGPGEEPLPGASAAQADRQEAANGISSPQMPATLQPPPGIHHLPIPVPKNR